MVLTFGVIMIILLVWAFIFLFIMIYDEYQHHPDVIYKQDVYYSMFGGPVSLIILSFIYLFIGRRVYLPADNTRITIQYVERIKSQLKNERYGTASERQLLYAVFMNDLLYRTSFKDSWLLDDAIYWDCWYNKIGRAHV